MLLSYQKKDEYVILLDFAWRHTCIAVSVATFLKIMYFFMYFSDWFVCDISVLSAEQEENLKMLVDPTNKFMEVSIQYDLFIKVIN